MSAEGEEEVNHWPPFVDALSTVLMVVCFLLVIMSAAVMVLSQRIIAEFKAEVVQRAASDSKASSDAVSELQAQLAAAQAQIQRQNIIQSPDAPDGQSQAQLSTVLRQDRISNAQNRLTIRTRETADTERVRVAAIEDTEEAAGVEVTAADVLMRIDFEEKAVEFTQEARDQVKEFLETRAKVGDAKIEIWSFVPQTGSMTEAQRKAFYRAVQTRNQLVKSGIDPKRITTQIRITDPSDSEGHSVQVVLKP